MDTTPYRELKIAPRAVFDSVAERGARPRFMVPTGAGGARQWTPVTWNDFADQIRRTALFLIESGFESGDRAAIFAPNRVEWMSAALGIQAAGGVMVPIYPSSTAEQAAYIIEHSDSAFVFVDTEALLAKLMDRWSALSGMKRVVLLSDVDARGVFERHRAQGRGALEWADLEAHLVDWRQVMQTGARVHQANPGVFEEVMGGVDLDANGVMLYTSGTTGRPKGVPLTHRNVGVNGRDWLECNAPALEEEYVDLLWLPMSHIFGFGEACLGNTLGFTSYLSDPLSVLDDLPVVRPHVFMSVPRYYEKIAARVSAAPTTALRRERLAAVTGGRLKFCLSGGAGLEREIKELFYQCGLLIIEGYGLTEAGPTLTLNRPDDFRFDSVGKPLPSVQLRLAEDGEILARGESIFTGYHKEAQSTADAFDADGWLRTGDLGRWTEDGFLRIVGRKKEILVTAGGKNIAPLVIEEKFVADPIIAHAVVYGDEKKYLVCGIWLDELGLREVYGSDRDDATIHEAVRARVAAANAALARYQSIKVFKIIHEHLTVENGLLTPTLKVKRRKVYAHFGDVFESMYA